MVSETSTLRVTVDFNRMNYGKWFLLKCVKIHPLSPGSWSLLSIAFRFNLSQQLSFLSFFFFFSLCYLFYLLYF